MAITKTYDISVIITKVNGRVLPADNLNITGPTLAVEGHASATVEIIVTKPGGGVISDDTSSVAIKEVSVKFGSMVHPRVFPADDGNWSLTIPVPIGSANTDGQLAITATAQVAGTTKTGTSSPVTVIIDNQKPTLAIARPFPDEPFVLTGTSVSVPLEVTATDNTQVAEVKWSLDTQDFNNAIALDPTGRGNLTFEISVPQQHIIYVRARDISNNVVEESRTIDVVRPFTPVDPADITGEISYFGDLLGFASRRIKVTSNPPPPAAPVPLSAKDFANIFCQRFDEITLPQNHSVMLQSVHQARISVDVLRKYFVNRIPQGPNQQRDLAKAEAEYRQTSYDSLLRYLGTSVKELRRAITAMSEARTDVADRLGIGAEALSDLLLTPNQVSEEKLETTFGLADTHFVRDPFAANMTPPRLLVSRRAYLRTAWRQQDDAVTHPVFKIPLPIIDPDLVQLDDVAASTAVSLWKARLSQIQQWLTALRQVPGTNQAKFEAAINLALKPTTIDTLKDLSAKNKSGNNVGPQLQALFLEVPAFIYLMELYALLTGGGSLADDEWEQVYSILVQCQKLRDGYPEWRSEEIQKGLTLGPDDFELQPPTAIPLELPLWRATQSARQAWKVRLAARIDQNQAVTQELQSVVDSAEAIALPVLRDRLINLIKQAANQDKNTDTAEQLTAELFIDLKSGNGQKISWVGQAIETLQGILFALRMGRLSSSPVMGQNRTAGWELAVTISSFEDEWQWMGNYAGWCSAMNVFLFPENFLQPATRPLPLAPPAAATPPQQTRAFQNNLVVPLRGLTHVTRATARAQVSKAQDKYLDALIKEIPAAASSLGSFTLQEPTSIDQINQLRSTIDQVFTTVNPHADKFQEVENWVQEVFYFAPMLLAQELQRSGEYLAALDWYAAVYAYTLPTDRKIYKGLILEENDPNNFARDDDKWLLGDFNPHKVAQTRGNVYTRFTIRSVAQCLVAFADDQFTKETVESIPQARARYAEALNLLNLPEMKATSQLGGQSLENSLVQSIRDHANMNLLKLRNGLNIAGLERPVRSETAIRTVTRRPTPYRYPVLIERAKQLTATAGQIEASFLSMLEKSDAEHYSLLKAQQDMELSRAQAQLQNLRALQAQDGVQLATQQRDRAQGQVDYYQKLLAEGLLDSEQEQLDALRHASWASMVGEVATLGTIAASVIATGPGAFVASAGGVASGFNLVGNLSSAVGKASSDAAQLAGLRASFDRRKQEWEHQLDLSQQDLVIGNQQITLSQDGVAIAQQEVQIATIQVNHTIQTINFLANKFTNAELFDWMSRVLERVYAFFLQQATAIARLAQAQLAFERQEELPNFIQSDYWQAPDEGSFGNGNQGPDRRGLTGSERLLQAITELDQYAFLNDHRKLQMSKTFSLAALAPLEFQRFRETGVMPFATPMEYFDRDFPGHYLRLIKQLRTTVAAFVPPMSGIHATLINSGVSRVTINDGGFQDVEVHHGPQSVALTAPVNATGVFELNPQPELLQPFEAIGVDTSWEFRLPKPANQFDFDTIADVVITIDYTALESFDYRQQVIQRLNPTLTAERAISLRDQFADQWYELNNSSQNGHPMQVSLTTKRQEFLPNLEDLKLQQLVFYVVRANGHEFELMDVQLLYTVQDQTTAVGGKASSSDGIISTRRGNAASWTGITGNSPIGTWELTLPNTEEVKNRFKNGEIDDILLVLTYAGQTPAWPA